MKEALDGVPQKQVPPPEGIVTVRIDPETGSLAGALHEGAVFESFRKEHVPTRVAPPASTDETGRGDGGGEALLSAAAAQGHEAGS